jgi:hypothetical protein
MKAINSPLVKNEISITVYIFEIFSQMLLIQRGLPIKSILVVRIIDKLTTCHNGKYSQAKVGMNKKSSQRKLLSQHFKFILLSKN